MAIRKTIRRLFFAALLGSAALAIAVVIYVFSGSTAVESWVGTQILDLGASYLNPELHFDKLTYHRPYSIILDNLTLTSPDPANAGQSIVILAAKKARLELTEIPRKGQPIKFSEVILDSPEFRAVSINPGSAGLVGFSNLLKSASSQPVSASTTTTPTTEPKPLMKLSDFLLLQHVEITDGHIVYDPRLAGTQPMDLDQINMNLQFAPAKDDPGTYALQTTIDRKPIFNLDLAGTININTLIADLAKFKLTLDLQEKNAHYLPPQLQQLLNTFEITGQLQFTASGKLPIADYHQSNLAASLRLNQARAAAGKYRLTIDSFAADATLANGATTLKNVDAKLLGGDLKMTGGVPRDPAQPANFDLNLSNIQIEQTLRLSDPNSTAPYAGKLSATINYSAPLSRWNSQSRGTGTLTLRQGRIDRLPILGDIIMILDSLISKSLGQGTPGLNDTADAKITFAGNHIQLDSLTGQAGALAFRGGGSLGFDQQLDLHLNAGLLETLQGSLGVVGDIWAAAADKLAGYRVTGTFSKPKVSLEIGGR